MATVTVEKKITEMVEIDLSKPKYVRSPGCIYYKFESVNEEIMTTSFDTVFGFSLNKMKRVNHDALMLNEGFTEITEDEFNSTLKKLFIEYKIIDNL